MVAGGNFASHQMVPGGDFTSEMVQAMEAFLNGFSGIYNTAYTELQNIVHEQEEILNDTVTYDTRMKKAVRHIRQSWSE